MQQSATVLGRAARLSSGGEAKGGDVPGITDLYVPARPEAGIGGGLGQDGVIAPPGVPASGGDALSMLGSIVSQLRLPEVGVFTPWGGREGDLDWFAAKLPPSTNISLAELPREALELFTSLNFGAPLSWIAVHAPLAVPVPTTDQVQSAFVGTPYEFFETVAVYSQRDPKEPPKISLLHWARLRSAGDPEAGRILLHDAAHRLGGKVMLAMQVNYDTTKLREPPATPFLDALHSQIGVAPLPAPPKPPPGVPAEPPLPGPPEPGLPAAPPKKAAMPWLPIIGAGVVTAALGFVVVRSVRAKKGR
jgi:hypothetical protein